MKQKILELIRYHIEAKNECNSLLEELNQINNSELSYKEDDGLEGLKMLYQQEHSLRGIIISQLEDLL